MYTYLNQKYGLKSIVVEQTKVIIHSIQLNQDKDHDVKLFGKVLRHEVDEEFRYTQLTIKSNIQQVLKTFLREKHPTKSAVELQKI